MAGPVLPWPAGWGRERRPRHPLTPVRTEVTVLGAQRHGVLVPMRLTTGLLVLSAVAGPVLLAAAVLALVTGLRRGELPLALVGAPVLALVGALLGSPVVVWLVQVRGRVVGVLLTPEDLVLLRAAPVRIPWDQVRRIEAYELTLHTSTFRRREGRPMIGVDVRELDAVVGLGGRAHRLAARLGSNRVVTVGALTLDGDPTMLWHALHHYWQHADLRPELAGPAGLRRIRAGDYRTSLADPP